MTMVGVAQLVEHWIVAPEVVGSKPIAHPILLEDRQLIMNKLQSKQLGDWI